MRGLLALTAAVVVTLLPACSVFVGARDKLAEMEEPKFRTLVEDVYGASVKGGELLKKQLEDPRDQELARRTLAVLNATVMSDQLDNVDDLVRALLTRFGDEIGNDKVVELLKDATNLLDAAVGQIKLGLDKQLTLREKTLLGNLLKGMHDGLL